MLLSDRHRFIFLHIQKTGGSSIAAALERVCPGSRPWPDEIPRIAELPGNCSWDHPWHHPLATAVRDRVGAARWDAYFTFAFVRNPWARQVSWYNMLVESGRWHMPDFATFLTEPANYDAVRERRVSQVDYLSDREGNRIVDYVGRFEHLKDDFAYVCWQLGVRTTLPHYNPSAKVDYRSYYTPELRQLIAERFARDIAAFGYAF